MGAFRATFLISIIFFLYFLFPSSSKYPYKSISYKLCKNFAPKIYAVTFRTFGSFNKDFKLNEEVKSYHEVKKVLPGSSK